MLTGNFLYIDLLNSYYVGCHYCSQRRELSVQPLSLMTGFTTATPPACVLKSVKPLCQKHSHSTDGVRKTRVLWSTPWCQPGDGMGWGTLRLWPGSGTRWWGLPSDEAQVLAGSSVHGQPFRSLTPSALLTKVLNTHVWWAEYDLGKRSTFNSTSYSVSGGVKEAGDHPCCLQVDANICNVIQAPTPCLVSLQSDTSKWSAPLLHLSLIFHGKLNIEHFLWLQAEHWLAHSDARRLNMHQYDICRGSPLTSVQKPNNTLMEHGLQMAWSISFKAFGFCHRGRRPYYKLSCCQATLCCFRTIKPGRRWNQGDSSPYLTCF